jgi:AcrR family transcriptional regulator
MVSQSDPRVKRTRRAIEQAFWELMKAKGFDGVTISQVTARAGINRATFYAHYADKVDVVSAVAARAFAGMIPAELLEAQEFSEDVCRGVVEVVNSYVFSFYDVCRFDDASFVARIDSGVRQHLYRVVLTVLGAEVSAETEDTVDTQPDTRLDAAMISAAIYGAVYNAYVSGGESDGLAQKIVPSIMAMRGTSVAR